MKPEVKLRDFTVPVLLLALNLVPVLGGAARMLSVSRGAGQSADDARFLESPHPVVIHIVAAAVYGMLGAFQFSTAIRRRWPRLHRRGGYLVLLAGMLVGLTGLWMTVVYRIPDRLQGSLLFVVRLAVGLATVVSLVAGLMYVIRGDVARHEAYMIRAYALAAGAGTQVFVLLPWMLLTGQNGGLMRDVLMTFAWLINVVAAERIVYTRRRGGDAAEGRPLHPRALGH